MFTICNLCVTQVHLSTCGITSSIHLWLCWLKGVLAACVCVCVLPGVFAVQVCAGYGFSSMSMCWHGLLQHECVLVMVSGAQVCADMFCHSTSVYWLWFLQHERVLTWSIAAQECAGYGFLCFLGYPFVTQNTTVMIQIVT